METEIGARSDSTPSRAFRFVSLIINAEDEEEALRIASDQLAEESSDGKFFILDPDEDDWDDDQLTIRGVLSARGEEAELHVREGELARRELSGREVSFTQKIIWGGFGVDDYESNDGLPVAITAESSGAELGQVELLLRGEGEPDRLRFIEVEEASRRQGIASALLDLIEQTHGEWETNDLTDDGAALISSRG